MIARAKESLRGAVLPVMRAVRNPFADRRFTILHSAHHRVGTVWFGNVLGAVAREFFLRYHAHAPNRPLTEGADLYFFPHGGGPVTLDVFRASHMIRDPREVVVSGYFYHLWTEEPWAHMARPEWGGKSYQEHLNTLDQEEGIAVEMRRFVEKDLSKMVARDYSQPNVLEMRYEDVIAAESEWFPRLFAHYGFRPSAVERATEIALGLSFERVSKRLVGEVQEKSHLRSGRVGQWREVFSPSHIELFKQLAGSALVTLGYESDETW